MEDIPSRRGDDVTRRGDVTRHPMVAAFSQERLRHCRSLSSPGEERTGSPKAGHQQRCMEHPDRMAALADPLVESEASKGRALRIPHCSWEGAAPSWPSPVLVAEL